MKQGIFTTEFWITTCSIAGAWALEIQDKIPSKWAMAATLVGTLAYNISRGLAKNGK